MTIVSLTDVVTNIRGIALEFVVTSLYDLDTLGDVLGDVRVSVIIEWVTDVLVYVMTVLGFVLSALLEESKMLC